MLKNNINKGFTLIELLIVISIIGILSSVILAALAEARINAKNVRIQEEVITLRNYLQLNQLSNGTYSVGGSNYGDLLNGSPWYWAGVSFRCDGTIFTARFDSTKTEANTIVNDIILLNGGVIYPLGQTPSSNAGFFLTANNCVVGPINKVAIYAAYAGNGTAGSSGYICLDTSGNRTESNVQADYTEKVQSGVAGTCQ